MSHDGDWGDLLLRQLILSPLSEYLDIEIINISYITGVFNDSSSESSLAMGYMSVKAREKGKMLFQDDGMPQNEYSLLNATDTWLRPCIF